MDFDSYTAQERAAWVAWQLATGVELSTKEIAEHLSVTRQGAESIMNRVSRVAPVYKDVDYDGRWRKFNHTT